MLRKGSGLVLLQRMTEDRLGVCAEFENRLQGVLAHNEDRGGLVCAC